MAEIFLNFVSWDVVNSCSAIAFFSIFLLCWQMLPKSHALFFLKWLNSEQYIWLNFFFNVFINPVDVGLHSVCCGLLWILLSLGTMPDFPIPWIWRKLFFLMLLISILLLWSLILSLWMMWSHVMDDLNMALGDMLFMSRLTWAWVHRTGHSQLYNDVFVPPTSTTSSWCLVVAWLSSKSVLSKVLVYSEDGVK